RRKGLLSAVTPAGCKPGSTSVSTNDTGFPLTAAGMTALSPKQAFEAQSLESRASFAVSLNQIGVRHLFNKRLLGAIFFAGLLVYLSTPFVAAACCTADADCAPSYHYCVLGNCYSCKYDSDCPDPFNRFCTHGYCTSSYCRDSSGICVTSDGTGYPSDCCDQIDTSGNFPGGSWRGSGCAAPGCHPWVPPICSAPPPSACTGASGFDALV